MLDKNTKLSLSDLLILVAEVGGESGNNNLEFLYYYLDLTCSI